MTMQIEGGRAHQTFRPDLEIAVPGLSLLVFGEFLLQIMFALIKFYTPELGAQTIVFFRAAVAAPVALTWYFMSQRHYEIPPLSALVWMAMRAFVVVFGMVVGFTGLVHVPLVVSSAIMLAVPGMIAVLAWLFLGENITRTKLITLLGTSSGVAIVVLSSTGGGFSWSIQDPNAFRGVIYVLIGAACVAVSFILLKQITRQVSAATAAGGHELFCAITAMFYLNGIPIADAFLGNWHVLLVVGLLGAAAQIMFASAYIRSDASFLAPFHNIKVVLAGLIGLVAFAEVPTLGMGFGAVVILAFSLWGARPSED